MKLTSNLKIFTSLYFKCVNLTTKYEKKIIDHSKMFNKNFTLYNFPAKFIFVIIFLLNQLHQINKVFNKKILLSYAS